MRKSGKNSNPIFSSIIALSLMLFGCTKDKTPIPVEECSPGKIYFRNDIMPIINSNCAKSGCHDAITAEEGLNLSTYEGVKSIVKAGNPSKSKLMEVINTNADEIMPPPPDQPLTSEQVNMISQWISEGALNNYCSQDTTKCIFAGVSYSADISNIISTNCVGCHSGSSPSGGINLVGYAAVREVALSGKLYNSVAQNGSAVPMPPSMKLSNCDIKKIKAWVDGGALNN